MWISTIPGDLLDKNVSTPRGLGLKILTVPGERLHGESQEAWFEQRSREIDDGLAFSPWNGIAAHRPLGSIMRLRKPAYRMSARFRFERSGCPMHFAGSKDAAPR